MRDLVIVGDEAWLPEEWERVQRRRAADRERMRVYRAQPGFKERQREYHRAWAEANRERKRAYNRDWMRRKRQSRLAAAPCLGEGCLTMTPGGRTCHFCRRTP